MKHLNAVREMVKNGFVVPEGYRSFAFDFGGLLNFYKCEAGELFFSKSGSVWLDNNERIPECLFHNTYPRLGSSPRAYSVDELKDDDSGLVMTIANGIVETGTLIAECKYLGTQVSVVKLHSTGENEIYSSLMVMKHPSSPEFDLESCIEFIIAMHPTKTAAKAIIDIVRR